MIRWVQAGEPDLGNAVTDLTLGNSTKLGSEVVADVARLQVIALRGSLNSGESSYLKVRLGVADLGAAGFEKLSSASANSLKLNNANLRNRHGGQHNPAFAWSTRRYHK